MENISNSICINNSIISETNKAINITKVYDTFQLNLQGNRIKHENKLLLENNFIEPSILLAFNYSLEKLSFLFEKIIFRLFVIGTRNSFHSELANCFIGKNILIDTNNLIFIVRKKENSSEKSKLFKCVLNHEEGLNFKESDLICEGESQIKEKIKILDAQLDLSELIGIEDLYKYVVILYSDLSFIENIEEKEFYKSNEIFIFPQISIDNYQRLNRIITEILKLDATLMMDYENQIKNSIINFIRSQINLFDTTEIEDVYFKNFIFNRRIKRNLLLKVINTDNLLSKAYMDFFEEIDSNSESILHDYFIINSIENIPTDFVLSLNLNLKINSNSNNDKSSPKNDSELQKHSMDSYNEDDLIQSINLLKDKKISNEAKSDLSKRIISKIIISDLRKTNDHRNKAPISIAYISSFYSMLYSVSNSSEESDINEYEKSLFQDRIENNIYKTFEEFKDSKLNFLKKKAEKFFEQYIKLESQIASSVRIFHYNEINHFNSACKRYTRIINDLLNIPINFENSLQITNEVDLEATLLIYKKLIENEFEEYNSNLIMFYAEYARNLEKFYFDEKEKIEIWFKSIIISSSAKIEALTMKYKNLIVEMKLKLDNYVNEIIERDMKFIISIKAKLGEVGYLNEFLAKYLSNIQYSLSLFDCKCNDIADDETLRHFMFTFGFNGGISIASGLATFGLTRIITIIGADALSGTSMGPIGTIVGATVGALSLVGTSVFTLIKNKKKLKERFAELQEIADEFRNIVYDKILEFRILNKEEMQIRLRKIISYVELSVRKSIIFLKETKTL